MATATRHGDLQQPRRAQPTAKSRIGLIVALSMAAGLIAAVLLVAMPFIPATENVLTSVVLLAFALGWALLTVLSTRFSDQPQRWAAAPATFMAVAGLVSLSGSAAVHTVLSWVWPPVLFGLVVWMFLRVRRDMRSRIGRWLLYPVLAVLMIAAIGGGYQTVRESLESLSRCLCKQVVDLVVGSGVPPLWMMCRCSLRSSLDGRFDYPAC
jgi:FtsH-binding integral membrane protein